LDIKKERVDSDQLTKRLVELFFKDFLEFFCPDLAKIVDFNSVDFPNKELYSGIIEGEKTISDVLAKVNLLDGQEQYILIHLEIQSSRDVDIPRRMFRYFCNIWMKHEKPVYAFALFIDESRWKEPISNVFTREFMGTELTYKFHLQKTKNYKYEEYLDYPNPIVTAFLIRMNYGKKSRALVKAESMKRIEKYYNLTETQIETLLHFIDRLLFLDEEETKEFKDIIKQEEYEEVNKMMLTTLQEEILEEKIKIEKLEIAKKSLQKGYPIEEIAEITGLLLEEVKKLEAEIKS
jgi:predicted transposase/invertase (TIGR01784 family)